MMFARSGRGRGVQDPGSRATAEQAGTTVNFSLCSQYVTAPPGLAATRGEWKLLRAQCSWPSSRYPLRSVPRVPLITHLRHPRVAVGPGTSLPQWEPSASGQQRGQQHQGAREPRSAGRWPHRVSSRLLYRIRGARERIRAPPRLLLGRERGLRRRLGPVARGPREERRERALGCARPVTTALRARSVAPMSLPPHRAPPHPRALAVPKGPLGASGLVRALPGGSFDLAATPPSVPAAVAVAAPSEFLSPGSRGPTMCAPRGHC